MEGEKREEVKVERKDWGGNTGDERERNASESEAENARHG